MTPGSTLRVVVERPPDDDVLDAVLASVHEQLPDAKVDVVLGADNVEPDGADWTLLLPAGVGVAPGDLRAALAADVDVAVLRPRGAPGGGPLYAAAAEPGDPRELPVLDVARAGVLVSSTVAPSLATPLAAEAAQLAPRIRAVRAILAARRVCGLSGALETVAMVPIPLSALADEVPLLIELIEQTEMTDGQRKRHLRAVLHRDVHDRVLVAAARGADDPTGLERLGTVVRERFPVDVVDGLPPRPQVFARLLRDGFPQAAWLVAKDNAVGFVSEDWRWSTSSGAPRPQGALSLLTVIESERAYAWLPGFRDPRYGAPDSSYDVGQSVRLRCHLEEAAIAGGALLLSGWAYLTELATAADEQVCLVLTSSDGAHSRRFRGQRVRRPDRVKGTGVELTRLAYAGWSARIDVATLAPAGTASWHITLEIEHEGLRRTTPLGPERSAILDRQLAAAPARTGRATSSLRLDEKARLVLRLRGWPDWRRRVPGRARAVLRRIGPAS